MAFLVVIEPLLSPQMTRNSGHRSGGEACFPTSNKPAKDLRFCAMVFLSAIAQENCRLSPDGTNLPTEAKPEGLQIWKDMMHFRLCCASMQ